MSSDRHTLRLPPLHIPISPSIHPAAVDPPVSPPPPRRRSQTNIPRLLPPPPGRTPIKKSVVTPRGTRDVYACPFEGCDRVSAEHSNMKAHMRLHTGERPYVCSAGGCNKSFRWKSSLSYHERALHSKSRPFKCVPCRKSFVEKRKLRMHWDFCPAIRRDNEGGGSVGGGGGGGSVGGVGGV